MNFKFKSEKNDSGNKISIVRTALVVISLTAIVILMVTIAVLGMSSDSGSPEKKEIISESTVSSINL